MARSSIRPRVVSRDLVTIAAKFANAAQFDIALDLLRLEIGSEASLLEARIALRTGQPLNTLEALSRSPTGTPDQQRLAVVLASVARARLAIEYQEVVLPPGASESTKLLALYFRASEQAKFGFWQESRLSVRPVASCNDSALRCLGLLLQAHQELHDRAYSLAFLRFDESYQALCENPDNDEAARTSIAFGMASLALETLERDRFQEALEILSTLNPSPWTARRASDALSFGAQIHDLTGELNKSYQMLLRAREIAPTGSAIFASIETDLASSIERQRAPQFAAVHREHAKQILFSINWDRADIDDRAVLLHYAIESSLSDIQGASKAVTLALSREGKRNKKIFFEHDGRAAILGEFVQALVLFRKDELTSVDVMLECQKRWLDIGFKFRALDAGIKLLRLGYPEGLKVTSRLLRAFPRSAQRIEIAAIEMHPSHVLSAAELRVVEFICEGLTSRQIAEKLGRSPATIRNQTISVFRRLGVSTRSALVSLMKDSGAA